MRKRVGILEPIFMFLRAFFMLSVSFFAEPNPDTPQSQVGPYPSGAATPGGTVIAPTFQVIGASGAISLLAHPMQSLYITKAGVAALTLAEPIAGPMNPDGSGGQDGMRVRIISQTAFAHTVTTPAHGIQDGSSTTKDTLTFAALAGAIAELEAYGGKWNLVIGSTTAAAVATEV